MTFVWFLFPLTVPAAFKSFLLHMFMKAPESMTNSLSSGSIEDGAGRHKTSEGEENSALF